MELANWELKANKKFCSKNCYSNFYRKIVICKGCKTSFQIAKWQNAKFCSRKCFLNNTWKEDNNPRWKGDKVGYHGVHDWLNRIFGKADRCELCGASDKRMYHWCKKLGAPYFRNRENFIMLCVSCHRKYDWREEWSKKISASNKGQHHSPATEFKKGSKWTPELREKIMKAREKQGHIFNT
jgi:hypothetical protein